MSIANLYNNIRFEIHKVISGLDDALDIVLAALLTNGHVLLEGVPGTGKTMLARTMSQILNMEYRRIQMTPDLLPGDITGSSIYREDNRTFEFRKGPVFTNFLLIDEINRASARTQSALLESMQEMAVSYDGTNHRLPEPFIVFATQNPVEHEGTYPLPLAQLDRFMFKALIDYPQPDEESWILSHHHHYGMTQEANAMGEVQAIVSPEDILKAREEIRETFVREEVIDYTLRLVQASRDSDSLLVGASPRAGLMLLIGAKSLARFADRDFVTPDDIQSAFLPAMRHRVILSPAAELEGVQVDDVLVELLEFVEVPR